MRSYTDLQDFKNGIGKIASMHKKDLMMPVILEVDGHMAPFGICLEKDVNGVSCIVLTGTSTSLSHISKKSQDEQIAAFS